MAFKNGQKVNLGTIKVKGKTYAPPSKPWRTDDGGNLINYNYTNHSDAEDIEIVDTLSGKAITWIYVEDKGKKLLVCDRNLVGCTTWDGLNGSGLIFGKTIRIDGKKYKVRSLTGGVNSGDKDNEWDRIIANDNYNIGNSDSVWHWSKCYSWCQETYSGNSGCRALRGYSSASTWGNYNSYYSYYNNGFRPVLEILNTAPLISDTDSSLGDKVAPFSKNYTVTDKENNRFTITEKIDGETIRTLRNQTNGSFTISVSNIWNKLKIGTHKIIVIATDVEGESSTRTWSFKKTNTPPIKPIIKYPLKNMRVKEDFYVEFVPRKDNENNKQYFVLEVADNSNFTKNKREFKNLEKKKNEQWVASDYAINEDIETKFRIKASGLSKGEKYIRIYTVDKDGSNIKVFTETINIRVGDVLLIETHPFETNYYPKAVNIDINGNIDSHAKITVYVCNNALDKDRIWEDATAEFIKKDRYVFKNKDKKSENYAIATKVKVEALFSIGEISIKSVGLGVL